MPDTLNDNDALNATTRPREPDAHGQAAYLLVESLIHGLVANSTLSAAQAIEVVETAAEVKAEVAEDMGDSPATAQRSLGMLHALGQSLRADHINDGG